MREGFAQVRKYYVIYDHRMNSKHIPRNFYYRLDSFLDRSRAEKVQYSVIACTKKEVAWRIVKLCEEYEAEVKMIEGEEIDLSDACS